MDTSNLCRSCMKEVTTWERENFDDRITYMYSFCTNVQLTDHDSLPKQFCYDCRFKIEAAYTYIKEAKRVNTTLLNLTKPSVIVEPHTHKSTEDTEVEDIFDTNESSEAVSNEVTAKVKKESKKKTINGEKYDCTMCKKSFLSKVWFEKHLRNQHGGTVYSCSSCSKTFQKPSQLNAHAVTHSEERNFVCACGKRYKRRKELTVHAQTHAETRPYQCDHCNMSFKLKSVLKCHLVLHQPDKPYLCNVCGWRFTQAGNLFVHMRTHTGAKPYVCACGFRAAAASSLRRHERRHRALRPHRCRSCQKGFHDKGALTRHERSHSGARPYQCPACAMRFVDSWKRKTHLMRAHRTPLARIPRMRADATAVP